MNREIKIFFIGIILLVFGVTIFTYYKYVLAKEYKVTAQVPCDPTIESCFVYECDPENEECSDEDDPEPFFYAILQRKARFIPLCNPSQESCEVAQCEEDEVECKRVLCDHENDEQCAIPEDFQGEELLQGDGESDGENEMDIDSDDPEYIEFRKDESGIKEDNE